jgi:hypothetical protein
MDIIQHVEDCLSRFPKLRYDFEKENHLTVYSNTSSCNIYIQFWEREHTMFYKKWHWHFENNDAGNFALIELLVTIVSNRARVKIFKRSGKPYRWDMELPDDYNRKKKKIMPNWLSAFKSHVIEYDTIHFQ